MCHPLDSLHSLMVDDNGKHIHMTAMIFTFAHTGTLGMPTELILKIFRIVRWELDAPHAVLQAMCACRCLFALLHDMYWEEVDVSDGTYNQLNILHCNQEIRSLIQRITIAVPAMESVRLPRLVRTGGPKQICSPQAILAFCSSLHRLQHLELIFYSHDTPPMGEIISTLSTLTQLTHITLNARVKAIHSDSPIPPAPSLANSIQYICIIQISNDNGEQVNTQNAHRYFLSEDWSVLDTLVIRESATPPNLAIAAMQAIENTQLAHCLSGRSLTTLYLDRLPGHIDFVVYFSHLHLVTTLTLKNVESLPSRIPSHVLPKLTRLQGPPELLIALLPTRPVHTVELSEPRHYSVNLTEVLQDHKLRAFIHQDPFPTMSSLPLPLFGDPALRIETVYIARAQLLHPVCRKLSVNLVTISDASPGI